MAADSNKFPAWFITFVCVSSFVALASAQCVDGTYKHDGRDCCLCAAGEFLIEHCITSQSYGKCDHCGTGTYNSQPNSQMSCEPCKSCSHPNSNLEKAESCTAARDTECRCKKDHYCTLESCTVCHPCTKCGEEGIKEHCTRKSDAVCNEKTEGGSSVGIIVGIILAIVLLVALGLGVFMWKKKKNQAMTLVQENGNQNDVEMQLIEAVDLEPHLLDIAQVIGWKDMKDVARRSKIPATTIESCELNHPGDTDEQTIELLKRWVESQGKEASRNLVKILLMNDKKSKAEKVKDILYPR